MNSLFHISTAAVMAASMFCLTLNVDADGTEASATDQGMIVSAMSAAPAAVTKDATIVTMEADGTMRTLRQGSGEFTCMPDNPATPGPDPMCMDKNSMEWVHAWIAHEIPPLGQIGFMYMLAGGTDASNTDPYATQPEAGNHWIETGPHVMIVGGDAGFLDTYPKSADPDPSRPYVMWADTPYRHLMAPVK